MKSGKLKVDGAELYYEIRGHGPALVLIAGAGGDAGYYAKSAEALADAFTVITYDRRGNSRSTGRVGRITIAQQAADAKAIIDAFAGGRALVFGNSAGAIIGLALTAAYPAVVLALIAHEPPVVRVLPENDPHRSTLVVLSKLAAEEGIPVAAELFVQGVRGEGSYQWPAGVPERFGGNVEYFFEQEFDVFAEFIPDFEALKRSGVSIIMAAGSEDRGLYYARPSQIIAERLGVPWTEITGYHLPFMERPIEFAAVLRALATMLFSRTDSIAQEWRASAGTQ